MKYLSSILNQISLQLVTIFACYVITGLDVSRNDKVDVKLETKDLRHKEPPKIIK